ncbi:MAG: hypothetical protein KBD24_01885 [Candidatus Pacebacteria bacterium]|nr:hypothetical protein [Candidatus Paceibacterota bacterium]
MPTLIRKASHAVLAVTVVFLALYIPAMWVVWVGVILVVLAVISRTLRIFDPLRHAEGASYGELFFGIGVVLCGLMFLPEYPSAFVAGMLVLGFADTGAALAGRRWGTHIYRVFGEKRSWEGSATACMISFMVLVGAGVGVPFAFFGALLLAGVEALSVRGSDNLVLPIVAGVLTLL